MRPAIWFTVAGLLLVGFALASSTIKRLPLTTALLYLGVGFVLGPRGAGLIDIDPIADARLLERVSELVLIVSLFSAGLKLRAPLGDPAWREAIRLASLSMTVTVGLVALAAVYLLDLSWGAAILVGAILSPTDPVLASDVQVGDPFDTNRLRFSLTAEAGLNDGTAFPFVMLGLAMMGLHDPGGGLWRWVGMDVLWAMFGGVVIGIALGEAIGRLVIHLRRIHKEALGADDFIAIGLIALAHGVALFCHASGFLAVFAAGLALRGVERRHSGARAEALVREAAQASRMPGGETAAVSPEAAPAYMAEAVRHVTEYLERFGEIVIVMIVGALLSPATVSLQAAALAGILMFLIRPIAVLLGLAGRRLPGHELRLVAWFGIRGVGSVYYLVYVITHGVQGSLARELVTLTLTTVALSTVVHGISVTPLMRAYGTRAGAR